MGRFLDAASAPLGVCWLGTYESELAMELEAAAGGGGLVGEPGMDYEERDDRLVVLTGELSESLIELLGREPVRDLAYTGQVLAGRALAEAELKASDAENHCRIGRSDGKRLRSKEAARRGVKVLLPKAVPAGDCRISPRLSGDGGPP